MTRLLALLLLVAPALAHADLTARFAYRAPDSDLVEIQGDLGDDGLAANCPTIGTCRCEFSGPGRKLHIDAAPNLELGTLSCLLPPRSNFKKVEIFRKSDRRRSTTFDILRQLPLAAVLGDLDPYLVNRVYRYSCLRTFFEGEGVAVTGDGAAISCVQSQRLGIIMADYNFYLFDNDAGDGNMSKRFGASFHPAVCERPATEFARNSCSGSRPELRYGFYKEASRLFNIRIQLTRAPEQSPGTGDLTTNYGYAAAPDKEGNCAPGLVKANAWTATPASITAGSIDGINPPSNFINTGDGMLDNTLIETSAPANFLVIRQANETPCNAITGSCASSTFAGVTQVQSVPYVKLTPTVCVISRSVIENDQAD